MSGKFYFPEMLPPGVALFDYNNDGNLDVYLVQGEMLGEGTTPGQGPPGSPPLKGRLFRNDLVVNADGTRTLHFTDVTEASGIDARGYGMGVATGDFNNDGCIDLYLTFVGRNRLYRNNCDGTFTD
ncbi:MAG: RNA-binding protein, partial [Acidobacteria bacterium]